MGHKEMYSGDKDCREQAPDQDQAVRQNFSLAVSDYRVLVGCLLT